MTLTSVLPVIAEVYHQTELPIPAIAFPLIAICVFTLLGFVAWSYRDVANRHAGKPGRPGGGHGPSV